MHPCFGYRKLGTLLVVLELRDLLGDFHVDVGAIHASACVADAIIDAIGILVRAADTGEKIRQGSQVDTRTCICRDLLQGYIEINDSPVT